MDRFTDPTTIEPPGNLDELIARLKQVFAEDKINVEYVQALMTSYKSNPKDWKKFAIFDPYRYARNLVDEGNGKFNLIALCWGESNGSSIHSHANSHCFMKVLDGELKETMYAWPAGHEGRVIEDAERDGFVMQPVGENSYKRNQCAYINDNLGLHSVENTSHCDRAVSLHLYSPPFDMCDTFDQRTGARRPSVVTFFSKFGQRTPYRPPSSDQAMIEAENN
ncbi:cysteine dioxygenase type 1-like [Tubulanus polymorphus]|uniref:cysteine dioxygenase type 1-like n=1 Tax=Tubulanus polymorphus TaxID=672921 RepID=UPI003DA68B97